MKRLLTILLALCIAVPAMAGRHHKHRASHHRKGKSKSVAHHHHHGRKGHHRHVVVASHVEPPKQLTVNDILTRMFEAQKGCFALPVQGQIASTDLRTMGHNVTMPAGMDIQCRPGEKVHAVHDGVVTSVFSMDKNESFIVIIQHGYYFSVYNSLESTIVKKGDQVNARQAIGVVGCNDDGQPMLNFQIWKAGMGKVTNKSVNPNEWFARM